MVAPYRNTICKFYTSFIAFPRRRASWYYRASDLRDAAIRKHGKEVFEKKVAARAKRRARAEAKRALQEQIAATAASSPQAVSTPQTSGTKRKATTPQDAAAAGKNPSKRVKNTKDFSEVNSNIDGSWLLSVTKPEEEFDGTGELNFGGKDCFFNMGEISIAGLYGNIHGFKGDSDSSHKTMKFETKWKTCGKRYGGTLTITLNKDGTTLKGKYNCGVPKRLCGNKVG